MDNLQLIIDNGQWTIFESSNLLLLQYHKKYILVGFLHIVLLAGKLLEFFLTRHKLIETGSRAAREVCSSFRTYQLG